MNPATPTEPNGSPWPAPDASAAAPKPSNSGTSQGNGQHTFSPEEEAILAKYRGQQVPLEQPLTDFELKVINKHRQNNRLPTVDSWGRDRATRMQMDAANQPPRWAIPLLEGQLKLVEAITAQVAAINRLAASNEDLVRVLLTPEDDEDPGPPSRYLDGKPRTL